MIYILDAGALIAYVRDEAGADAVAAVLLNKANLCFAHAINFCEVFYDFYRTGGLQEAEDVCRNLIRFGVELREDVTLPTWQRAATIKAIHVKPGDAVAAKDLLLEFAVV